MSFFCCSSKANAEPEMKKKPTPTPKKETPPPAAGKEAEFTAIPVEIKNIEDKYILKQKLGKGRYGMVRTCVDKQTNKEYAVKIINGKAMKSEQIINDEVLKLKKVGDHPNVVKLFDFFKDVNGMFYIVMELCNGGDLFSRIVEDGSYSEKRAAELLKQLASALQHIHSKGITHRDLKPENILLSSKGKKGVVKIVDFGLSKLVKDSQLLMTTVIGTWAYCAPEVFADAPYTNQVDTWALGVLMFIMLSGYHPFDPYGELSDGELINRITNDEFDFDEPEWEGMSEDAKTTIRGLLKKNPEKRMKLDQFLKTKWVNGEVSGAMDLSQSMKRFQSFTQKYGKGASAEVDLDKINSDMKAINEN